MSPMRPPFGDPRASARQRDQRRPNVAIRQLFPESFCLVRRGRSRLPIYVAPMTDLRDRHTAVGIIRAIDNPKVADAHAIDGELALELDGAGRTGSRGEIINGGGDSLSVAPFECAICPSRSGNQDDVVRTTRQARISVATRGCARTPVSARLGAHRPHRGCRRAIPVPAREGHGAPASADGILRAASADGRCQVGLPGYARSGVPSYPCYTGRGPNPRDPSKPQYPGGDDTGGLPGGCVGQTGGSTFIGARAGAFRRTYVSDATGWEGR